MSGQGLAMSSVNLASLVPRQWEGLKLFRKKKPYVLRDNEAIIRPSCNKLKDSVQLLMCACVSISPSGVKNVFCWSVCVCVTVHVACIDFTRRCDEECAFATVGLFILSAGPRNESYQPSVKQPPSPVDTLLLTACT